MVENAMARKILPGRSYPLGATYTGRGVNFALFSANAEKVELCLFDAKGRQEERIVVPDYIDEVWCCFIPGLKPGQLYGYRVYGKYDPESGHRFNGNKLLVDPYAKAMFGKVIWSSALFPYKIGRRRDDLSFDDRDSAKFMPKCVVVAPDYDWGGVDKPCRRRSNSIIYEVHVKDATILREDVPAPIRGTVSGLAEPGMIGYFKNLGITAVELLPVQSFFLGSMPEHGGLHNYWGYNTVNFFTPEPSYLSGGDVREFKDFVRAYHQAGLEVFMDVVYNHTAEGNHLGPVLSFKGIDNASYYRLVKHSPRFYYDTTGVGNTLDFSHPRVIELVMDSLRYWAEEMMIDGFRFDLAVSLGRTESGFIRDSDFYNAIAQDPVMQKIKKIAEPWDVGQDGYQLGNFPVGWSEWNGRFRDTVRKFWRGDEGQLGDMARRFTGSAELFERRGRRPWSGVNFISSHDGFTANDLVSYNEKHNAANGEDNRDGDDGNNSCNYGAEGPSDDAGINEIRLRQVKNMLATAILSQGLPMLAGGDEFARSKGGNNNTYSQDNAANWFDWTLAGKNESLLKFVKGVIALRREHIVFRRSRFFRGALGGSKAKDITWLTREGREMKPSDWNDPGNRVLIFRLSGETGDGFHVDKATGEPTRDVDFFAVMNADVGAVKVEVPKGEWSLAFDTSGRMVVEGSSITVPPRSFVMFEGA
ncbi:MAG: glycogen debranching protein GlgX [Rickettsiales bacterium]|jgi:glycogen operon protein|nr:glycogen debranching protein GlgX [Rickettsiales bacterium]